MENSRGMCVCVWVCVPFPQAGFEKLQKVGGVMVDFTRPGKHEKSPSSASRLQSFKVSLGKNSCVSGQTRNSPVFVSITFQVHCSGDLTLCGEPTGWPAHQLVHTSLLFIASWVFALLPTLCMWQC